MNTFKFLEFSIIQNCAKFIRCYMTWFDKNILARFNYLSSQICKETYGCSLDVNREWKRQDSDHAWKQSFSLEVLQFLPLRECSKRTVTQIGTLN